MSLTQSVAIAKKFAGNYTTEDNRIIDVTNPPIGSGLTAIVGDGTDENTAWVALLAYASTNKMNLYVPADKTISVRAFTIPTDVKIIGHNRVNSVIRQRPNATNNVTATLANKLGTDGNFEAEEGETNLGVGWRSTNAGTFVISGNVQTFTATAKYGKINIDHTLERYSGAEWAGHVMYARALIKADSNLVVLVQNHGSAAFGSVVTGQKGYRPVSVRYSGGDASKAIAIQDNRDYGWTAISVKKVHWLDLTEIFGAGNEPTQTRLDHWFEQFESLSMDADDYFSSQAATLYEETNFITISEQRSGLGNIRINGYWWYCGYGDAVYIDGDLEVTGSLNDIMLDKVDAYYAARDGIHVMASTWIIIGNDIKVAYCQRYGFYDESTDNSFTEVSANDNKAGGVYCYGFNTRWVGMKTISNGGSDSPDSNAPGLVVASDRNMFVNIDAQENAGHGVILTKDARGNTLSNIISENNGADWNDGTSHFERPSDYETAGYKGDGIYFKAGADRNAITPYTGQNRYTAERASQNRGYVFEGISYVVENCEDAWADQTGGSVTCSTDAVNYMVGTKSASFVTSSVGATTLLATEENLYMSLVRYNWIKLWIKSTVALASGDLQLLLDNSANCASPLETLNIPAVLADTWTQVIMELSNPSLLNFVASIGLKQVTNLADATILLDDIQAVHYAHDNKIVLADDEYNHIASSVDDGFKNTVIGIADTMDSYAFADTPVTLVNKPSQTILCDCTAGAITVNLFSAVKREGTTVTIQKNDASGNAVTIDAYLLELINGAATDSLASQYSTIVLISDGTNWRIVSEL